jgi:5S rRNA maturation endonuclease (ribonuclease M5)
MDSLLMKMKNQNQSHSIDQNQLKSLGDGLCDNIEELFEFFNIEYRQTDKMLISSCPIHGGDNITAFNIYPNGDNYRGNWKCRTHQCESVFMPSIIGFVRGVLSNQKHHWQKNGDETVSFGETLKFIKQFLQKKEGLKKHKPFKNNEQNNFIKNIKKIGNKLSVKRSVVRQSLIIPAKYYIHRNYSNEILDKYDVGLCLTKGKPMYGRAVVPIYDHKYQHMIGCTGRSIYEKCGNCSHYHNESHKCPDISNLWKYPKWKHSKGFKAEDSLYNFWFAKEYIEKSKTAIIVESPGNVWRLEENGIHNSVAIFGASISNKQKLILDTSGAMNIIILTDNDVAGEKAKEQIISKFKQTYKIFCPQIYKNDVGDLSKEEIESQIIKFIKDNNL